MFAELIDKIVVYEAEVFALLSSACGISDKGKWQRSRV